eukprot:5674481-Prorocentrum_lima.AAC.1
MTSSLVGSEMCIRDRAKGGRVSHTQAINADGPELRHPLKLLIAPSPPVPVEGTAQECEALQRRDILE